MEAKRHVVRLVFVVPWYGPQATGGAETAVRKTAEALYHRAGLDVEVLTTCSAEFNGDWSVDTLPAGLDHVGGVPVRRFPVRPRNTSAFDALNARLMGGGTISGEEERVFIREMINSDALVEFVRAHRDEHFFVFTPYMFGTTWAGSAVAPDRSAVIPALHDESYARLGIYAEMFRRVRGVAFYSRAEMALARRLYHLQPGAAAIIPAGVDAGGHGDGARFRARHGLGDYLLYAGRKETGKNLPLLLEYFARYREGGGDLALVLVGKGPLSVAPGERDGVMDLGFVSEQEKWDAYAGAVALCQPSVHESFSLVMMEAWLAGIPSLVHAGCAVTREYCLASHGGLYFADDAEFVAALDLLRKQPAVREALGRQGGAYVLRQFTWDTVVARWVDTLARWGMEPRARDGGGSRRLVPRGRARAVHQLLSGFRAGDAISHEAQDLRAIFRAWGFASEIFAADVEESSKGQCGLLPEFLRAVGPDDVVVYHHSIYSDATEAYVQTPARRVFIYHNITPPEYFAGVSSRHEHLCRLGRDWLPALSRASERILADSNYNAEEVRAMGDAACHVLPVFVDLARLESVTPDPATLARYGDGRVNVLFVGRLMRNKRQDDVLEAFRRYHQVNPRSRLILVGSADDDGGAWARRVRDLVVQSGLGAVVELLGSVSAAQLVACYRSAHAFVCMSEHEGFCIPLVEAMLFDVPVIAYAAAAVPETLGGAGVLVQDKDPEAVAGHIRRLVEDESARRDVLAGQRRRLKDFDPSLVASTLRLYLDEVLEGGGRGTGGA